MIHAGMNSADSKLAGDPRSRRSSTGTRSIDYRERRGHAFMLLIVRDRAVKQNPSPAPASTATPPTLSRTARSEAMGTPGRTLRSAPSRGRASSF